MAFTVNFYNFAKRENATYRPTGTGTEYSCILKEASSIANPTIQLDIGTNQDPTFNYCYIPEFNRYYWITDWTWIKNRLWEASLSTDLLATFRDYIGNASMYVLRSSAASDGNIIDNYYPVKANATVTAKHLNLPWTDFDEGCVVIGVTAQNAQLGSVTYYALELDDFAGMVAALLDDTLLDDSGFLTADASLPLQKALLDPLSYIKSAVYLPISYETLRGSEESVHVWTWDLTGVTGKKLSMTAPDIFTELEITLDPHPLSAARGNYLNVAPYTKALFQFIPFNAIDIDTTVTATNRTLTIRYFINPFDGSGTLQLFCGVDMLGTQSAQVGVPIQLSQITKDYLGFAQSTVNAATNVLDSIISGNVIGAVTGTLSGIGNGFQALTPRVSSLGANGTFSHLHYTPSLYQEFYTPVDEDLEHAGRPLCQIRQISSLPGYLLIKDAEVDIPGFTGEAEAVRAYLESGFFYG